MKKVKRLMALSLVACMGLSMTACGNKTETSSKNTEETGVTPSSSTEVTSTSEAGFKAGETFHSDEPVTYSLLFSDHENYPAKDDWLLWKTITERTNVSFDITYVPRKDYVDKRNLLVSSGQAPLIIPKTYPGEENIFVTSGTILPVSDYLDYMPNFKEKIEKWGMESDLNQIRQGDGKFYVLPGLHEAAGGGYSYLIRKDIFDELGITIDEKNYTYEDFYTDMKKVKEAYPDNYVLSDRWLGESMLNIAAKEYGVTAGWGKGSGAKFDWDKDEFYFAPTSDNYKEFVTYYNKLIEEKILDPESFTQTDDQAVSKFTTGKSFVITSNTQVTQDLKVTLNSTLGEGKYEVHLLTQPGGPAGQLQIESSRLENGVMISAKALDLGEEEFKKFMNFVDWLWYSDEGQELVKWGVEGETYDVVEGKRVLKSDIYYNGMNDINAPKKLNTDFGFAGGVFAYGGSIDLKTSMYSEFERDYYNRTIELRESTKVDPPIMSDEEESEENNLIVTPLMDYVTQMTLKFILGDVSIEEGWDAYVAECQSKGSDKFITNVNNTYQNTKHLLK